MAPAIAAISRAADAAQHLEAVALAVEPGDRRLDGGPLAGEALVVDAGATADPILGAAP